MCFFVKGISMRTETDWNKIKNQKNNKLKHDAWRMYEK